MERDMKIEELETEERKKEEKMKKQENLLKEQNEEIKKKDEEMKRKEEEFNEYKKHSAETDKKLKKEICSIWPDFVGRGFEVENGVLGLEQNVYFSIVKFLGSHILRKV
jgi:aspartate carbamoyltransferase catalytic subunit